MAHEELDADPLDRRLMTLFMFIFLIAPIVIAVLLGVSIAIGGTNY